MAALKKVEIREEEELDEFMVEVDILSECVHNNIVGIKEAFFYDSNLWVSGNIGSLTVCILALLSIYTGSSITVT